MVKYFKKILVQFIMTWLLLIGNIHASTPSNPLAGPVQSDSFFSIPTHDDRPEKIMNKVRLEQSLRKVGASESFVFNVDDIYRAMVQSVAFNHYRYSSSHRIPFSLYAYDSKNPKREFMGVVFLGSVAGLTHFCCMANWSIYDDTLNVKVLGQLSHKELFRKLEKSLGVDIESQGERCCGCCSQQ